MKGSQIPILKAARCAAFALIVGTGLVACGGSGSSAPSPALSLSLARTAIVLGQSTQITWSASPGTACTASGGWSGTKANSGTETVTPDATGSIAYALSCSGTSYGGSVQQSVALTVNAPSAYSTTPLVADTAAASARTTDANLVNPWGIAFGPTTPVWVANNHSGTSTLYDGIGLPQPAAAPLVVNLKPGANGDFDPTGIVFNGTTDFAVVAGASATAARFIFVGEGGMIAGWSPNVDPFNAVTKYEDAGGAIYKGVALANNGSGNFLYATDFHNNKIDVFDASFRRQMPSDTSFAFKDPTLPAGYAPFGIQAIKNGPNGSTQIYVTYAKQQGPDNVDDESGPGLGLVNVFDANGKLVSHLIAPGGKLNAPWGVALAPSDFGTLSNALLVGNFGDGRIYGFDPGTGEFIGTVSDAAGTPFAAAGLWGIAFGNDASNQPHNTLFFAAGINDEANGLYGRIDLGANPPVLNPPPAVTLTVPPGNLSGAVTLTATAQSPNAIAKVEFFVNGSTSIGVATAAPFTIEWDTTSIPNGPATLVARATDSNGNVGSSAVLNVTIANGAAAATLSQIQSAIFTQRCAFCHDGSQPPNGALPGSMNLTAGNSYASIVNVPSLEQSSLPRIKAGDPDNSYLIRKLEGAAGISGARMPLGGPFLDQATIDQIRSWIAAGAQNN